jgi:E3 ubiquitin-protein ligase RNF5
MTAAAARFGNFTFSAGFGIFPSLFGFHMQGFPDLAAGGGGLVGGAGYPFGFPMGFHGAARAYPPPSSNMGHDQQETKLSRLLMFLGFLVVLYILFF